MHTKATPSDHVGWQMKVTDSLARLKEMGKDGHHLVRLNGSVARHEEWIQQHPMGYSVRAKVESLKLDRARRAGGIEGDFGVVAEDVSADLARHRRPYRAMSVQQRPYATPSVR